MKLMNLIKISKSKLTQSKSPRELCDIAKTMIIIEVR